MKIYLVRHGETDWNKERRLQGHADIPLNVFGRELAQKTAEGLKDISFDIAYTSPLIRAKETAQIIIGDRKIPCFEEPRLQEIGFGEYEGLCCSKDSWNIPNDEFDHFFHAPQKYQVPQNGESFQELLDRTSEFMQELFAQESYRNATILIATHGAALRAILNNIREIPLASFWEGGVHLNCAVTIIEYGEHGANICQEGKVYYDDKVVDYYQR